MLVLANLFMKAKLRAPAAEHPSKRSWWTSHTWFVFFRELDFRKIKCSMTRFLPLTGAFSFDVSQFIWMTFSLSIVRCSSRHQPTNRSLQVAILNVGVISGWIIPSVLADYFGTYNVGIPCVISCGILSFTLLLVWSASSCADMCDSWTSCTVYLRT